MQILLKSKVKSSTGFLYTLQNMVYGVIIQYISIPIQLLLALHYQPVCTLIDYGYTVDYLTTMATISFGLVNHGITTQVKEIYVFITRIICISMVTNQNRLTPNFRFFLFDKFEGNTLLHNVLKNLVPSMSLYPSFRQFSKPAISHRDTFQRNKTG